MSSIVSFVRVNYRKVYCLQSIVINLILIKQMLIRKINMPILSIIYCLLCKNKLPKGLLPSIKSYWFDTYKEMLIRKINMLIFFIQSIVYFELMDRLDENTKINTYAITEHSTPKLTPTRLLFSTRKNKNLLPEKNENLLPEKLKIFYPKKWKSSTRKMKIFYPKNENLLPEKIKIFYPKKL